MKPIPTMTIVLITLFSQACTPPPKEDADRAVENKALQSKKIELSEDPPIMTEQVIEAMGGQEEWEDLKYVSWTFFGARHLIWDKANGRVRIESPQDTSIYLLDMASNTGRYSQAGRELKDPELLASKMARAKSIWINDMYWLFMPFKMHDPGVLLKYERKDTTDLGATSSVFSMTFDRVGETPDNKYEVYVDPVDHLIVQWDYFEQADQEVASASWPWDNYQDYHGLLLSADRSDGKGPSNVRVYESLKDGVFSSFEEFEYY